MRSNDYMVSASIAGWPETRTTIKTPAATSQSSPFMVSLPIEPLTIDHYTCFWKYQLLNNVEVFLAEVFWRDE